MKTFNRIFIVVLIAFGIFSCLAVGMMIRSNNDEEKIELLEYENARLKDTVWQLNNYIEKKESNKGGENDE